MRERQFFTHWMLEWQSGKLLSSSVTTVEFCELDNSCVFLSLWFPSAGNKGYESNDFTIVITQYLAFIDEMNGTCSFVFFVFLIKKLFNADCACSGLFTESLKLMGI